jgi:hypothetical protein
MLIYILLDWLCIMNLVNRLTILIAFIKVNGISFPQVYTILKIVNTLTIFWIEVVASKLFSVITE